MRRPVRAADQPRPRYRPTAPAGEIELHYQKSPQLEVQASTSPGCSAAMFD